MPVAAEGVADAVRIGAEIFRSLGARLSDAGLSTNVGDEGGFAPALGGTDAALGHLMKAIEAAGYRSGRGRLPRARCGGERVPPWTAPTGSRARAASLDAGGMIAYYEDLVGALSHRVGRGRAGRGRLGRLGRAHGGAGGAHPAGGRRPLRDQRGAARARHRGGRGQRHPGQAQPGGDAHRDAGDGHARATAAASPRSCPTARARPRTPPSPTSRSPPECGLIKAGAPSRTDRTAKYNQLIRIEEAPGRHRPLRRPRGSARAVKPGGRAAGRPDSRRRVSAGGIPVTLKFRPALLS